MPRDRRCGKRRAVACRRRWAAKVTCLAAWLTAGGASLAQSDHGAEHLHTPLETSADLAWDELIAATLGNFPQFVELAAADDEADALSARSRTWLAAPPQVLVRYQSDRPWDNVNLREYELGLSLPLWRPGERRTAAALGALANDGAASAALAMRHEVIGLLRGAVWDIERAAIELTVARDGARVAADIEAAIEQRHQAGDVPLSETLLVRSNTMERQASVIAAEALLVDAERAYQSLTGLATRPAEIAEPLTDREDFDSSHPLLMLADAELERARAEVELTRRAAKGRPSLTLGPLQQQGAFSSYAATSLNVSLSLPFGGRAHTGVDTAAASRAAAEAESGRLQLLRQLDLELHEARHTLLVIEQSLELARQRSELADRSFRMSQEAYAQGEITVLELLRSEETALLTQTDVAGLEVDRQRAIAEINQATGVWP